MWLGVWFSWRKGLPMCLEALGSNSQYSHGGGVQLKVQLLVGGGSEIQGGAKKPHKPSTGNQANKNRERRWGGGNTAVYRK